MQGPRYHGKEKSMPLSSAVAFNSVAPRHFSTHPCKVKNTDARFLPAMAFGSGVSQKTSLDVCITSAAQNELLARQALHSANLIAVQIPISGFSNLGGAG